MLKSCMDASYETFLKAPAFVTTKFKKKNKFFWCIHIFCHLSLKKINKVKILPRLVSSVYHNTSSKHTLILWSGWQHWLCMDCSSCVN